jgi:hypothetical protein
VANAARSTRSEPERPEAWVPDIEFCAWYQETRRLEGRVTELEMALTVAARVLDEAAQLLDRVARQGAVSDDRPSDQDYDLEDPPVERPRHFP